MASNTYKKLLWLVRTLSRYRNGLTFEEINSKWQRCELSDEQRLSKRTFHNWTDAIEENLDIVIRCSASAPYRYFIDNENELDDSLVHWALSAFSMGQLLTDNMLLKSRILVDDIPSADDRLETILTAMRHGHRILIRYHAFYYEKDAEYVVDPYVVKLSRNRWYVVAHSSRKRRDYIFALDRMVEVHETDEPFAMRPDFSAEAFFDGCIGVTAAFTDPPCEVRLKITGYLRNYIETLPLHKSQKLVETGDDFAVYSFRLRPDNELLNVIMGYGECCEVLEPRELRDAVRQCGLAIAENNR